MNRVDRVVLSRVGSRVLVTIFVFYGLIALVESLDTFRFNLVAETQGIPLAIVMVAASAVRWTIKTLPVTVLLGAILGFIDLKVRHEMTVIQASGISIWKAVRAPVIALMLFSLFISLGVETVSAQLNRALSPTPASQTAQLTPEGEMWLEERTPNAHYVIMANGMDVDQALLRDVTIFQLGDTNEERVLADQAVLGAGEWVMQDATLLSPIQAATTLPEYRLPASTTPEQLQLRLASADDMTFFELVSLLQSGVDDESIRTAATMRLVKLLALPLVLTGSLLIAFAFTAGYRRGSNYGPAVLYGVVLGFVVFVITEMADRAGSTGVLDPTFAAFGPAFVAIVIGVTVLLHKEDGRA